MLNMTEAMIYAMGAPGAVATAFVEFKTARAVAGIGNEHVDFDSVTPTWTEMLLAMMSLGDESTAPDSVNDIVITVGSRHHLLRPLRAKNCSDMYLYLVVDKVEGSIPMARLHLSSVERSLEL